MKRCPKCQKLYPDSAQFCMGCDGELEFYQPPESKAGKVIKAFLKAFAYIFLWLMILYTVEVAFLAAAMMRDPTMMAGLESQTFDVDVMMEWMSKILMSNYTMFQLVVNLITILVICLFFTLRKKNPAEEIRFRPVKGNLLPICALYGIALNIFIVVTISFIPIPTVMVDDVNNQYSMLFENTNIFVAILSTAVTTGIVEEIIFRGLVLSRLKKGMRRGVAVVFSALIFGMFHGALLAVAYAVVVGIVFGLLAERHNSIIPSIVCHIFFNTVSYFLATDNVFVILALYFISVAVLLVGSYVLFKKDRTEE